MEIAATLQEVCVSTDTLIQWKMLDDLGQYIYVYVQNFPQRKYKQWRYLNT